MVQRIFREYIGGRGDKAIAEGLNRDGIPCPSAHRPEQNRHPAGDGWQAPTVAAIVQNPFRASHRGSHHPLAPSRSSADRLRRAVHRGTPDPPGPSRHHQPRPRQTRSHENPDPTSIPTARTHPLRHLQPQDAS
ncbi:recombinase family protein [Nocardia brasiliensis]|uniref:recombinase family protein n=1 Tax=Nocardia brasiliensis TaxID=37326 RepID=UPI002456A498|nr:recombinase family protein [Nocardia brasiliensis]